MPRSTKPKNAPQEKLPEVESALLDLGLSLEESDLITKESDLFELDLERFTYPTVLPLVPIRDNVYFPLMIFPLLVGRERSVRALEAAMEGNHRFILLAAQRHHVLEDPEPDDIYGVGVVAEVLQIGKMPDNTVRVMLEAGPRVRLVRFLQTEPHLMVQTEPIHAAPVENDVELDGLVRLIVTQFERLATEGRGIAPEAVSNVLSVNDAERLTDMIVPNLPLAVDQKQPLLETVETRERLERLAVLLYREYEILQVQKNIRARVEREMGDTQREFILREQMKAIQQELGERDERGSEVDGYRDKIVEAKMPADVEERAMKELERFDKTPPVSPEAGIIRTYLDWLIAMPWNRQTEETLDLESAEAILNGDHYGLEKVKERILEFLAVRKLAGDTLKSPILCFVGPPGVGKTSLGRSVARALGRKFIRVSLGGVRDEAEIRGHRRTYVGAMPGRIIQGIKQAGCRNPVFMLDEIDKLGSDFRGDPSSALLEALDPEQNGEFSDHYLEAPFDLRQVMFVTTANLLEGIPPALRDRLEVISFSGYIEEEKMAIAEGFLAPKQIENHGLSRETMTFEKPALRRLIREYTREAGVRNLEREIGTICRKIARRVVSGDNSPAVITEADVKGYLGGQRYQWGVVEEKDEIGTATGLVYTETGGDTIAVEVLLLRGNGGEARLTLTGQLGDVMKESAQAAWAFVRSRFSLLGLPEGTGAGSEIHIHVPAGAVPKDGPSAGITLATALASALSGRAVRRDLAMTGEITLRGKVLPVGGLKEKILAAHRAGIRHIIVPHDNEKDLEEIPAAIRAELCFELVAHADAVLKIALLPLP